MVMMMAMMMMVMMMAMMTMVMMIFLITESMIIMFAIMIEAHGGDVIYDDCDQCRSDHNTRTFLMLKMNLKIDLVRPSGNLAPY